MLPKVRAFTADDLDIVSGIFTDIPAGWSRQALHESLSNENIKSFVLESENSVVALRPSLLQMTRSWCLLLPIKQNCVKVMEKFC